MSKFDDYFEHETWTDGRTQQPTDYAHQDSTEMGRHGRHGRMADGDSPLERKVVVRTNFVRRPGWATQGQQIDVLSNYFSLNIGCKEVYMYNVTIIGGTLINKEFAPSYGPTDRRICKIMAEYHRRVLDKLYETRSVPGGSFYDSDSARQILYAYDGARTMFTMRPMKLEEETRLVTKEIVEIEVSERKRIFEVIIKYSSSIDMTILKQHREGKTSEQPSHALKALDIILLTELATKRLIYGQGIFNTTDRSHNKPISKAKEVNFGHFQSAKCCASGIMLNVDRFTAVFHMPGELVEVIRNLCAKGNGGPIPVSDFLKHESRDSYQFQKKLQKLLLGLKVATMHMSYKKTFKIKTISSQSAERLTFEYERPDIDGNQDSMRKSRTVRMSVREYFNKTYKTDLRYPNLPCVVTGSKNRPVFYPLEVLLVEANQSIASLHGEENLNMIKVCSRHTTTERFDIIKDAIKSAHKDSTAILHEFDISMGTDPVSIEARVIKHPVLHYGKKEEFTPDSGKWEMDGKKVFRSEVIDNWCIVNLSPSVSLERVDVFLEELFVDARRMGIKLKDPETPPKHIRRGRTLVWDYGGNAVLMDVFSDIKTNFSCKPNLVVFVIEEKNDFMYREVKYLGEIRFGVNTQCVTDKSVKSDRSRKRNSTLIPNLLLKINTKLDGLNCVAMTRSVLGLPGRTMIIGADVTHPNKGETIASSIAAVTASFDSKCHFYKAAIRPQMGSEEIIADFDGMIIELLDGYIKRNASEKEKDPLPDQIIFYRDGVSDGMFSQVIEGEIAKMRKAFGNYRKNKERYNPKLTVIIVQKRHHTRFIPKDLEKATGVGFNVPSGTVVDQKVVHPHDFDFYLCSQESTFGTCRPTHYYVLIDENEFTADKLQEITFALCHTYASSTRSISIPAPVQYAHLAAFRARHHLNFCGIEKTLLGRMSKRPGEQWSSIPDHKKESVVREITNEIRIREESTYRMYFI